MVGSVEASRSVAFLYLLFQILFHSTHTQQRLNDLLALL